MGPPPRKTLPALGPASALPSPGSPSPPDTCRAANTIISSSVQSVSSSSRSHRACSYSWVSRTGSVCSGGGGGWVQLGSSWPPRLITMYPDPVSLSYQTRLCTVARSARGPTWTADPNPSLMA